ncbi:glycosyltransferase family 4 protein [Clostridium botulinum]|uniref:Glycosyl transferase, group 1 family n=1 Tax=Clostridium botulinum D str. 1873 TaxID=592027 RepID=A0A9P2LLI4_CLOBO|nr:MULTISPECIES: glycosyltransferase [Clostridium]EES91613.1 glycosyl transferase, group 1 family [Clostridium botulinum D str. 1873]MBO3441684.1 glycosyltransferase [Clostridium haemolyticum]MCD3244558.1 glycosyltransferase family 4 protein [Clostridium botulinum C]MCD3261117.1 glycosyltransferase family 4 protein [Clostridium botulinum C]NFV47614.1 glycosyltransferase family 4 protein [Clostridium botulinum]
MRICYLADAGSVHTKKWCDFFKNKGYDIHVISLNPGEIQGVTVHSLDINTERVKNGSSFYKTRYVFKIFKIRNILKKIKPDILHAHYASSYGLIGALLNYHPYVISVWGSDIYEFPLKGRLFEKIIKFNLSKADKILSTSKAMAVEAQKYVNKHMYITPFGVDRTVFKPLENIKDNNKDNILIGTVKTLDPKYGMEYLIKAFAMIKEKYNNVKLEIAGDGNERKYLENLCNELKIQDDVKFLGRINTEEVVKAFNRFDIAVFPSNSESFGVAAVEAQACGVPVIVTNVGGLPEATCPGHSSIVVNKQKPDEIYEALKKLIEDKELRKEMGKYGVKFVAENFDVTDNFNYVNSIYDEISDEFNIK